MNGQSRFSIGFASAALETMAVAYSPGQGGVNQATGTPAVLLGGGAHWCVPETGLVKMKGNGSSMGGEFDTAIELTGLNHKDVIAPGESGGIARGGP